MVYKRGGRRRMGGLRKRRGAMRRRVGLRKPLVVRKKYAGIKYFTETFNAGTLTCGGPGTGGWFVCSLSSMINSPQYFNLFDLGTILRYDVSLIPLNGQIVGAPPSSNPPVGFITTCNSQNIQGTTGFFPTPTSQLSLLQETGSRTIQLDGQRILRFKCYNPKPAVSQSGATASSFDISGGLVDASGNFVLADSGDGEGIGALSSQPLTVEPRRKITWMNLNSKDAQATLFGGIKWWVQGAGNQQYQILIRVYAAYKEQN